MQRLLCSLDTSILDASCATRGLSPERATLRETLGVPVLDHGQGERGSVRVDTVRDPRDGLCPHATGS